MTQDRRSGLDRRRNWTVAVEAKVGELVQILRRYLEDHYDNKTGACECQICRDARRAINMPDWSSARHTGALE